MLNQIREDILKINAGVADLATQEKAKKLKKKLIITGISLLAIGVLGVITCFTLFVTAGMGMLNGGGLTRILIPFCLFVPFGIVAGIGSAILHLGLTILIGGATSEFVDKTINNRCECGNQIDSDEAFCTNCGRPIQKVCSTCQTKNDIDSTYCKQCGKKL